MIVVDAMRLGELSVLFIIAALTFMSLFIGAGTYAYYSGEPFIIDFSSSETIKPMISDLNPGDTVHIIIKVQNPYRRAATAWIKLKNIICSENGVVEPEREWYELHGVRNNLDEAIRFGLWIDRDGDTSSCSDRDEWVVDEDRHLADLKDKPIYIGKIPAGSSIILVSSYHMEEETENWAQSDSMTFDIELTLTVPSSPSIPTRATDRSRFELRNLTIKPETVYVGDEVEISVEVSNVGSAKGTRTILLLTNGSRADSTTVSLEAGESRTVSFELAKDKTGKYIVQVDGLVGSFTVLEKPPKPAEFMVRGLTISPSTVYPGKPVTVRVEVVNVGESSGNYTVNLLINGTLEVSERVTLEAGESVPVTFTFSPTDTGVYVVEVDGLRGSFAAITPPPPLKPAEFIVSDLSISLEEVGPGETVTVSVTVTNVGDLEGSYNVTLRVDGAVEAVETVTLAGGESTVVVFNVTRTDPGTYGVSVDGVEGVFTVSAPPPPPSPVPAVAAGVVIAALSVIGAVVLWRRRKSMLEEESY